MRIARLWHLNAIRRGGGQGVVRRDDVARARAGHHPAHNAAVIHIAVRLMPIGRRAALVGADIPVILAIVLQHGKIVRRLRIGYGGGIIAVGDLLRIAGGIPSVHGRAAQNRRSLRAECLPPHVLAPVCV